MKAYYTIKEYPHYAVSEDGEVLGASGRVLKPHANPKTGYSCVSICHNGKVITRLVHRLVAMTLIPNPENKPQVNHKNGIKTDNRVENLEWNTVSENQKHSIKAGLRTAKGIKNSQAKLNELSVRVIREAAADGYSRKAIAKYFKISLPTIYDIVDGRSWSHI